MGNFKAFMVVKSQVTALVETRCVRLYIDTESLDVD